MFIYLYTIVGVSLVINCEIYNLNLDPYMVCSMGITIVVADIIKSTLSYGLVYTSLWHTLGARPHAPSKRLYTQTNLYVYTDELYKKN